MQRLVRRAAAQGTVARKWFHRAALNAAAPAPLAGPSVSPSATWTERNRVLVPVGPARQRALEINEKLRGARSPVQVLEVVSSARADFNSVNLTTAFHSIAKLTSAQQGSERRAFFLAHGRPLARLVADIRAELPRFAGRQLAACAYASSLISHGLTQPLLDDVRVLLHAIGPFAARRVATMHSQGLANLAWAHAQADMASPEVFCALTTEALGRLPEFSVEGLSALVWSYAKLELHEPQLVAAIEAEIVARFSQQQQQGRARRGEAGERGRAGDGSLAAGKGHSGAAGWDGGGSGGEAGSARSLRAERMRPREITNLAWSFARFSAARERLSASSEPRAVFDVLAADALRQLPAFNPRDLSQLVWTYAKARHPAPELFERVSLLALPRLSQFNSQDFANMMSAYATAGVDADALFRAVAIEVEPRLGEFTPQGLVNLAWAFSKAGTPSARVLLESIANVFPPRLPELGARHLAMLVWAFARYGVHSEQPFRAVEGELAKRDLSAFNHIELVNTAWAFATARVFAPELFEAIAKELTPRVTNLDAQPLANIAWSLARSRTAARALFRAICTEVERRPLRSFSAQNQANLVWAFAVAGCDGPRLVSALAVEMISRADEFKPIELANLAWALSISGVLSEGGSGLQPAVRGQLVGALLQRIELLVDQPESEIGGPESLSQLHQANVALQLEAPELGLRLSPRMGERCAAAMGNLALSNSAMSARHRHVSEALLRLGHAHSNEQLLPQLNYRVDIALSGRAVVLEVNGRASYSAQREVMPSSAMKVRHMRLMGWDVIEIPFWEWPSEQLSQDAYLAAKLDGLPRAQSDADWRAAAAAGAEVASSASRARNLGLAGGVHGAAASVD